MIFKYKTNLVNSINEKNFQYKIYKKRIQNLEQLANLEQVQNDSNLLSVLLLGENQDLTDTMMLAIVNISNNSISLIGIPRDLYINGRKINSIYNSMGLKN